MKVSSEISIWRVFGAILVIVGIPVLIWAMIEAFNGFDWDRTYPRIAALGAATVLAGITGLVLSRVLGIVSGAETGSKRAAWSIVTYGAFILGIVGGLAEAAIWRNAVAGGTQAEWITAYQKAVFVACGCMVLTGLVALIGQRAAARLSEQKTRERDRDRRFATTR